MGGVIARYALADMEQIGLDHKTRLFVSHDAPQQGANIPVSVQYMFRHVTNLYNRYASPYGIQLVNYPFLENSILDQPATKQMLMNWVNSYSNIDNSLSSEFYTELRAKGLANSGGYPVNCRNIAISNGAECGITQGFNAGDNLLSLNTNDRLVFWQNLLVPLVGFLGGTIYADPALFTIGFVGLLPGQSNYNVDFWAKSIPYGTGNQIYKGRISYTKKLFKIFGWAPTITVNITNVQKAQPTGVLPIDHYAGGRYDTTLFTSGATLPAGIYIRDRFNFIPTPSALDIGNGSVALNDSDYKMAYVGATPPAAPKNSPFANFSTDFDKINPNSSNKTHISFNSRNGEWLAKELNIIPITTNCSFMCANTQIAGANLICSSATYSAPSGGTFYNWSITQGSSLVALTGNGTPNVTLTALPNVSGAVTLSLTTGDNWAKCGNVTLTKTIWVGKPNVNLVEEPVVSSWDLTLTDPTNNNFSTQGITSITWTKLSGNGVLSGNGYYGGVDGSPTRAWTITIKISITNSCGTTEIIRTYENPDGDHNPHTERMAAPATTYTIFPNPSNDIVKIELRDKDNQPDKNATIRGELFDVLGFSKAEVTIKNNQATLSVRGLNKGIYVFKIYMDEKTESHQIIIK